MELDIQAGGRYQIARDILANGKQCFLEGDVVVVEKVAEELPGYPGAVFIVKSAITGSCFRLSEADLVGVAATEGVQQEKRIGRVSREIQAGGVVLFHEGQQVEVVGVSTEPSGSVIAVSVRGGDGREYRLRPDAVTVQQGTGMTDAGN
ncbi:MAG: hypothetical protein FJY85_03295, partial [Deltaproteobacteria bacterium]|nr:hypothetical protein [Deltaproteobacteria bacterium]